MDGRGRWYRWDKKDTTEESLELSVKPFVDGLNRAAESVTRDGPICFGSVQWSTIRTGEVTNTIGYTIERQHGQYLVHLRYTTKRWNGERIENDYRVRMTHTQPYYGGRRWWFLCPLQGCKRRVGKLYIAPGQLYFGCRHCYDLTYESTQSGGKLLHTVDNRLVAIRRKLKGTGDFLDGPWAKPKYMQWDTYGRLCREYLNLLEMRERLMTYELLDLVGTFKPDNDIPITADDYLQDLKDEWEHHKAHPDRPPMRALRRRHSFACDTPQGNDNRLTLGEVAKLANVPYEFAREAQAEGLIRPDQGRDTRRKRYRRRLASWLRKLYRLRNSGIEWAEICAWAQRRWQPGHEHERRWPEGYCDG